MIEVNTHEAKSKLSALLTAVEKQDETVVICRAGKPIAELRAVSSRNTALIPPHSDLQPIYVSSDFDPTDHISEGDWPLDAQ